MLQTRSRSRDFHSREKAAGSTLSSSPSSPFGGVSSSFSSTPSKISSSTKNKEEKQGIVLKENASPPDTGAVKDNQEVVKARRSSDADLYLEYMDHLDELSDDEDSVDIEKLSNLPIVLENMSFLDRSDVEKSAPTKNAVQYFRSEEEEQEAAIFCRLDSYIVDLVDDDLDSIDCFDDADSIVVTVRRHLEDSRSSLQTEHTEALEQQLRELELPV